MFEENHISDQACGGLFVSFGEMYQ